MKPFWSIKDARGVTRTVGPSPLAAWKGLPKTARTTFIANSVYVLIMIGMFGLSWSLEFRAWRLTRTADPSRYAFLLAISLLWLGFLLRGLANLRAAARLIAAERLRLHRCAACNYSLEGTEPDDTHLRTCPECAATWELPPPAHSNNE